LNVKPVGASSAVGFKRLFIEPKINMQPGLKHTTAKLKQF
jgi:hypothetical protein